MTPQLAPPDRKRLAATALVLMAMMGTAIWWNGAPGPTPRPATTADTPSASHAHTSKQTSRSTPRRSLPTRTEADAVRPPTTERTACPLIVYDVDTNLRIEDGESALPATFDIQLTPPIQPSVTVRVEGDTAAVPVETVRRLQRLPFRDGTIYGEAAGVGLVSIALEGETCTRMQVLLVGPPPADAIQCMLDEDLRLVDIRHVVHASGPHAGQAISVRPWKQAVVLEDVPPSGEGWVQVVDHPPIPFAWDESGCDRITPIGTATVVATVTNPPTDRPTWVRGCGVSDMLAPGIRSVELTIPAVPCALEAWRIDGALRALSPLATVDPSPGTTVRVDLSLPEEQVAGLGIQFRTGDAGVTVARVWPESPAWHAGLRSGDRIVAVDGEPVGGLQDSDFIVLGTGPTGTIAELLVEDSTGSLETIDVERAPLENRHSRNR